MKQLTVVLFLFFSFNADAQESMLGKKSPELAFDKILNFEKTQANLADFQGKVVILDFWATWCSPCLKSFPQLEQLQAKFRDDVQVMTITDDPEERIKIFLEKRKMMLPIAIDETRALADIFPHGTIPHAVVIDKSGIVTVIATPSELSEELISKILSGQEVHIEEKKDVINFDPSLPISENENFTYQITITPYKDGFPSYSNSTGGDGPYKGRRILATNLSARSLFEIACQFPARTRTIVEVSDLSNFEWSRKNAVCFEIIVPEELGNQRFEIMKQQLDIYFDYQPVIEERVRPVKVLQRIKGTETKITESKKETEASAIPGSRGFSMKGSSIEKLANFLEGSMHKPVVDETNLQGLYDLEIPWYNENPGQIHEELKKFGMEMIDADRKIQVLVIKDK
ncbi:MAG: redoxin domain-containing protein [Bacteroidia bacterium]